MDKSKRKPIKRPVIEESDDLASSQSNVCDEQDSDQPNKSILLELPIQFLQEELIMRNNFPLAVCQYSRNSLIQSINNDMNNKIKNENETKKKANDKDPPSGLL